MAKEGHLLLTTWHCPVQCVTFVTNSTRTNVRIHSYKVFDTNECLYRYLRFLNSFATRSTANDGWTSSSPKCKMDPTVGQGPSDTDQTGIFSRHWCATICKGSPAQPPPEDTNTFVTYYLGIGAFKQKWWEKTLSLCPNCIIEASLTNKISISRLKRSKESERYKWSCDFGQL